MSVRTIRQLGILAVAVTTLGVASHVQAQTILFSDTFDRANSLVIDATTNGMSGLAAPMTYWESDMPILANDTYTQISGNALDMAVGPNASVVGLTSYNFTNSAILGDGGFSISMDITDVGTSIDQDRWCGFGIGLSYNAITNLNLDYNSNNGPRGKWDRTQTGVADFFVGWTPNVDTVGSVQIFTSGTQAGEQIPLTGLGGASGGTLRANFYPADFNSGSTVAVDIYFNNTLIASRNFSWHHTGENYISLSCRQNGNGMVVDNFLIQTITVTNAHPQLVWVGDGSANQWNTSSLNWSNLVSGALISYADGDSVTFNDLSANTTVNIPGTLNPGTVTVNNSTKDYTFSGGSLAGTNGLTKSSAGTLTLNQNNTFSGGILLSGGRLRLGNDAALGSGLLTLGGGTITSDGATARTVTNSLQVSGASGIGDLTDKGVLTFTAPVDFTGAGRTLTVNSGAIFAGGATNGRVGIKQGSGTLTIKGAANFNGAADVMDGTVIYDGATVTNSDRLIADAGAVNGIARLVITNGSIVTINTTLGNLRSGRVASTGSNYVDLAGLYLLPNAAAGSGNATLEQDAAYSEMTFWPGGDFTANSVTNFGGAPTGSTVFNFNGGILRARSDNPHFMEGLTSAYVKSGGARIDDSGYAITINQPLLDGGGGGGLTKLGAGTLTLSGNYGFSTYTGPTVVSNGTLVISTLSFGGGGALVVADAGNLEISDYSSSLSSPSLTLGASGGACVTFHYPYGNGYVPLLTVGNLTVNGPAYINISGTGFTPGQFPLMQFTSATGLANIQLGTVPPGVTASLVKNANSIDLLITSVVNSFTWSGAVNNNWDTTTRNWLDPYAYTATNYSQTGDAGDAVTFDDTAALTSVNLTMAVAPVSLTFNNSSYNYTFTGAGKITGVGKLIQNGFASVTLGTVNDYSGGTALNAGNLYVGADQALGSGEVTLNFGTLASDSVTARTLSNSIVVNADSGVVLGDPVKTGTLNLAGTLDLGASGTRTLQLNSDVAIASAGVLNNGGFTKKTGPGRLIVQGQVHQSALVNQQQGDVIIDGGWLESGDGWRMQDLIPGTALRFALTNGGLLTLTKDTANFKVGLAAGDFTATNILDVAGTLSLYSGSGNGRVDLGADSAKDVLILRAGGLVSCRRITSTSPGITEVDLDGGTLKPIADDAAFMQGLTNVYVLNGGVTVDTTNFNITIAQSLQANGTGGLTKAGSVTLTLSGTNTYTGPTAVNGGRLVLTPAHAATGGLTVASNATCAFASTTPGITVNIASVTAANGAALEAQFSGLSGNPTVPAASVASLILNGTVVVNVTAGGISAGQVPLIGYGSLSGPGSLVVGQLPQGIVGTIVTNTAAKTIDLVVSSAAPLVWKGSVSGSWDLTSTNWSLSGSPALYGQSDNVRFDDTASTAFVTLATALTPGSVTVSNSALPYRFGYTGAGALGGSMSLLKQGTNTLTLSAPNTFLGDVSVEAGTLIAGNATALGSDSGVTTVANGATIDIGGQNLGTEHIIVGGAGVGGSGALISSGGDQNDALRNVTLTGDAVIGGASTIGLRTGADSDLGLAANGHKLTKIGTGSLNLNGGKTVAGLVNTWFTDIGDINIQQGTLSFQRRAALGNPTNTITVMAGAALDLFSVNNDLPGPTNSIVLNNAALEGTGVLGDTNILGGKITVNGPSNNVNVVQWVGTTGPTLLYLNGPIAGAGGIRFDGSPNNGVIQLANTNTYSGDTEVSQGTLRLTASGALSGTPHIIIDSNATLDVLLVSPFTLGAGQTLAGSGTVQGSVTTAGGIAPGTFLGTLTVNGDLTFSGNLAIDIDKSQAQSNDIIAVSGSVVNSGSGTVNVANLGAGSLAVGDRFVLFPGKTVAGGNALNITGASATWTNKLAFDGSIEVLTVGSIATNPTNLTFSASGGSLNLSWPADHLGWHLEVQTNSISAGLWPGGWVTVPGSDAVTSKSIPIDPANPTVFYRLVSPQ